MPYLVAKPEDRFSHDEAHLKRDRINTVPFKPGLLSISSSSSLSSSSSSSLELLSMLPSPRAKSTPVSSTHKTHQVFDI